MVDLGSLATRLSDAADVTSAAERLASHLLELVPGGAVRVYLFGPGDRCQTCVRVRSCAARDRCLHLEAGLGAFARPPGSVDRIPRTDPAWLTAAEGNSCRVPVAPPLELEPPSQQDPDAAALLLPLLAAGDVVGAVGLRCPSIPSSEVESELRTATLLAASAFRLLLNLNVEGRRNQQLLLVNDLGRKVNSILDGALLLRQAAADIHRTFGYHNVMIFMRPSEEEEHLTLRAQASSAAAPERLHQGVSIREGIIGRCCRRGTTEIVANVLQDPDFVEWFPDTRSEIAVPIQIGSVVEGVLNVESEEVARFGESERLVLETVANQLATAIKNARLFSMVRERENRYRVLVEENPGAVVHLDDDASIIFANPAATELTGKPKEDLLSGRTALTDLAHEDSRDTLHAAIGDALTGTPRKDVEFQIRHADGTIRFAQASFQPLVGEDGRVHGVVVLARDRTRERELQDRLYQSEKLSAIGGLVSGVAHELNNPLAGILGFAQLLLSRPEEEWNRRDIEKIEKNAHRCRNIVENLLAFARQARMSRRHTNLNEVIESVLRLNEYQFHMDDIEIRRDYDLRIPPLSLDVNRWQQVFVNLASNAHQAIVSAQSKERAIKFETRYKDDAVVIRVCDTGPGIPREARPRVFEPFFTTKETGTGLGLGIVYGIVTEHGGSIELDPAVNEGTCFKITLPVGEPPAAEPQPKPATRKISEGEGAGRRVLVVDDEENVRDVVVRALENHKYSVDAVGDGLSALEKIEETDYDVVLCDVSMPGEYKGIELYDRVEEEKPELARRFVFLTGHLHDDVLSAQIEARSGRCIEKPFNIHDLAATVTEVATPSADG